MAEDFDTLQTRAEAGDAQAQFALGNTFNVGLLGQPVDLEKAIAWYQRAAEQNHPDAAYNLGVIGLKTLKPPRPDIAVPALEKACELGDHQSCCLLGESLIKGEGGIPRDPIRGARLLEKTARNGSTLAMNCIGQFLMEGRHLKQNMRRANAWFQRAAKAKDADGRFNLGVSLLDGLGIEQSEVTARRLFEAAARSGHRGAMYNLAVVLIGGRGGEVDPDAGHQWLLRAAEAGDADAQYELGQAYRSGRGVVADEATAVRWYRLAAQQNHAEGLFCLGLCLQGGIGGEQDPGAAEQCYTRAAMEGHGGAAHNLAIMYLQAETISQENLSLARELLEFAIAKGDDDALFSMGLFEANSGNPEPAFMWGLLSTQQRPEGQGQALLDHVSTQLDAKQQADARARADEWVRPDKTMVFLVQRRGGSTDSRGGSTNSRGGSTDSRGGGTNT